MELNSAYTIIHRDYEIERILDAIEESFHISNGRIQLNLIKKYNYFSGSDSLTHNKTDIEIDIDTISMIIHVSQKSIYFRNKSIACSIKDKNDIGLIISKLEDLLTISLMEKWDNISNNDVLVEFLLSLW